MKRTREEIILELLKSLNAGNSGYAVGVDRAGNSRLDIAIKQFEEMEKKGVAGPLLCESENKTHTMFECELQEESNPTEKPKMFEVSVIETYVKNVQIAAANEHEAERIVNDMLCRGEIDTDRFDDSECIFKVREV